MHRPFYLLRNAAMAALLAAAAGALVWAAAPQDEKGSDFVPLSGYELVVDGSKDARARLYQAKDRKSVLVVTPRFPAAMLLRLASRDVEAVDSAHLEENPGATARLLSAHQPAPAGKYVAQARSVEFDFQGAKLQLRLKPWLLKEHTSDDLKAYDINYVQRSEQYRPDPALVSRIGTVSQPVEVTVYFGSWCGFCQRYVPHLIKLEEELKGSKVSFNYFGLPRDFSKEPLTETFKIEKIPTAIVTIGGEEVGRLVGTDCQKPEASLVKVLQQRQLTKTE